MITGIVLISIGIIGAIGTILYGIRFMKKNSFILKGDYVEFSVNESIIINNKQEISNVDLGNDTELLEINSLDTELLTENYNKETELL